MKKIILGILAVLLIIGGVVWYQNNRANKVALQPIGGSGLPMLHDGYVVKNDKVYYVSLSPQKNEFEMKDADVSTFTPLQNGWGKDVNHVYYYGYTTHPADGSVPTIHINTFTSIPDTFYAKDDQAVYFPNFVNNPDGTGTYVYNVFPNADPATFVIVKPLMYAKDKNHVWDIQQGEGGPARQEIKGANPAMCTADNLKGCEAK